MITPRRLWLTFGLTVAWYVFVTLALAGASYLMGERVNLLWLWKVLLFPLGILAWLEVKLTEAVGVPGPGHLVLPGPWRTAVRIAYPVLHVSFVVLVIHLLLGWRARTLGSRVAERA